MRNVIFLKVLRFSRYLSKMNVSAVSPRNSRTIARTKAPQLLSHECIFKLIIHFNIMPIRLYSPGQP
jgi:hypothetical protein